MARMDAALTTELSRAGVPPTGTAREILEALLDRHRDTLEWKCSGLSDEQLKMPAVEPSNLTLLGLLRHMAEVEYYWFERVLLGKDTVPVFGTEEDPDGDFNDLDSHSSSEVLQRWKLACDASRKHGAGIERLDQLGVKARSWDGVTVSFGYILAHMVEEYARHNGHADLIRQRIDGQTGV